MAESNLERIAREMIENRRKIIESFGIEWEESTARNHSSVLMYNNPRPRPPWGAEARIQPSDEGGVAVYCACELYGDKELSAGDDYIYLNPWRERGSMSDSDTCWRCGTEYVAEADYSTSVSHEVDGITSWDGGT